MRLQVWCSLAAARIDSKCARAAEPAPAIISAPTPPLPAPPRPRGAEDDAPLAVPVSVPTVASSSSLSSASPSFSPHAHSVDSGGNTNNGALNPLLALQIVVAGEMASIKQRSKAAAQLEAYFKALPPSATLYMSYEAYLPVLLEIATAPTKATKDVQENVSLMLKALASHSPHKFVEWIAQNLHAHPGHEVWFVDWTCSLLLETECRIPLVDAIDDGGDEMHDHPPRAWREKTMEFLEFDTTITRAFSLWRTYLDYTIDPTVVSQIVQALRYLLKQDGGDGGVGHQWQAIILKKLQPHFVDIADVLIGWAMNASPRSLLREGIVSLLGELRQLWVDNSVFSTQLLSSFASDIITLSASSTPLASDDNIRLNTLMVCFMMVAQCVPDLALAPSKEELSVVADVIQCAVSSRHGAYSVYCLSKCAEYQLSMSSADPRRFSPLVVVSVRFLLTQTAFLSRNHDCEVDGVSSILEKSLELLRSGVAQDRVQCRMHAVGLLNDTTQLAGGNAKGKTQDEKVFEALLSFTCLNAPKLLTQLVICLVRVGGVEALKILAEDALGDSALVDAERRSYSLFCAACFVIAVKRHSVSLFQGDESVFGDILQKMKRKWTSSALSNKHPCHFRILLKLSRVCVRWFDLTEVNKSNNALLVDEMSIIMLRLAAGGVPNGEGAVAVPHLNETESLELMEFLLSRETLSLQPPRDLLLLTTNKVKMAIRGSKTETRDCCVRIVKALASRCGSSTLGSILFEIAMDLVLDPDQGIGNCAIAEILPKLASTMLVSREPSSCPIHVTKPDCSSFSASDFASITTLLSKKDTHHAEWHRKCTTIQARASGSDGTTMRSNPANSCLVLKTIRQAAGWCVQNRLRTHFGGPVETFLSIEHLLKVYATADAREARQSGTQEIDESWSEGQKPSKDRTANAGNVSKLMLLEFVGALEMYISNAAFMAEEDQSNPESESHKTRLFYRANKKVCEDWLSRYRPRLLEISNSLSYPELSRHHGYTIVTGLVRKLTRVLMSHHPQVPAVEWSRDIEQSVQDLDSALFSLCRNYCETKDADSIVGLKAWRDSLSSTLAGRMQAMSSTGADVGERWVLPIFPWLNGASLEAEMRYQDAAAEYEAVVSSLLSSSSSIEENAERVVEVLENPIRLLRMSHHALLGCVKQCAKCYAAIRDWPKLRVFVTKFVNAMAPIEDRAHVMEGCQGFFECYEVWKNELLFISAFETVEFEDPATFCSWASAQPRKSSAMQAWGILDELPRPLIKTRNSKQTVAEDYSLMKEELVRMALQPNSSNPIAGELIGKDVERVLLQVGMLPLHDQGVPASTRVENIADVLNGMTELNHASLDSGSWSKAYFGLKWSRLAQASTTDFHPNDMRGQYLVEVAKLARKQRNFVLADRLLKEAATVTSERHRDALMLEKFDLLASLELHGKATSVLRELCEKTVDSIQSGADGRLDDIRVQPLLRLAKACDQTQTLDQVSWMTSLIGLAGLQLGPVNGLNGLDQMEPQLAADQIQEMKGQYLAIAAKGGTNSCQAWLEYSDWCYANAKHELERIATQNGYIDLNPAEEAHLIQRLDALNLGKADRDAVVRCFLHLMENGDLIAHRHDKFRQLCILRSSSSVDSGAIDQIEALQKTCHSRAFRFHKFAAEGYGKYLVALADSSGPSAARSQMITVALRVLRLLTKFGAEEGVMDVIEGTFTDGPVAPWRQVVPQLLARAAHPLPGVSSLICKMLKRLAHHSPHLVVYPAVVDSQTTNWKQNGASSEYGEKGKLEDVLGELNSVSEDLVSGVQLLVSELRRISILWDEAWISTLVKLSADVSRRSSTLEKEAARVERNLSLSLEEKNDLARRKFVAIMKPILVSIERLWEDTCGRAGKQSTLTPHERFFLHQYGGLITDATGQLRDMCNADTLFDTSVGLPGPNFIWNPFTEILKSLQNSTGRNDSLPLQEISPAMASMSKKHFSINMPGVLSTSADSTLVPISVHEVRSTVMVLRTKTKPKCLEFVGSDGNSYKYLLKAREDLRLDERIMQFLKTVNEFLKADSFASARDLSAQNYSVIPLSQDSGLIQMVPDVTPMFQVFTNWSEQSNNARNVPASSPTKVPGSSSNAAQQQSPTAAFYMKLKQYGIIDVSPNQRPHWPEPVLKQVYHDLVAQRPRNVLQQEILFGSGDLRETWSKAARLSKSLAVMSALGYIIGLGDRHLDNILLCTKSGDVLHIDYNVCFDKGLKLKVPEIVPFRLTPMLQDALGLTGVEGKFRVAFETTLRIVRANDARESLLTLLEAFVYDPLVDWTAEENRRGGSEDLKSRLEVNVNLSLFLSRAEERRHDATAFEHQLDSTLTELSRSLDAVPTQVSELFSDTAELTNLEQQEEKLSAEATSLEEKLSECELLQARSFPEFDASSSRYEEIKAKLTGFANQCFSRHHQIEIWRGKCVNFPNTQTFATVLASTAHSSFSSLCRRLCEVATTARGIILSRELLASLHAKSQVIDAGVAHLRYSLELVMSSLHPWLLSYSRSREDVDKYVLLKTGSQDNNIYWLWWKRCEEYLQLIETGDVEAARELLASSLHSPSSLIANSIEVVESVKMVQSLSELEQNLTVESAFDIEKPTAEADFQDHLQHIFATLSGMKLSNAQGQRLLKLAGATWIVSRFGWYQRVSFEERTEDARFRPPILIDNILFRSLLEDAKACTALLDLVMTPKGAMKKTRGAEVLDATASSQQQKEATSNATKALGRFTQVLDAMQDVFVAIHDNFVLDVHGMGFKRDAINSCVSFLSTRLNSSESIEEIFEMASSSASASSTDQSLAAALEESSGIRVVLRSISTFFDHFKMLRESSPCVQGRSEPELSTWVRLILALSSLRTAGEPGSHATSGAITELFFAHATSFMRDHLVVPFERILSDIISQEWKFGFNALAEKTTLRESWSRLIASQMPEIFPSALTLGANPQSSFKSMEVAIAELMNTSGKYCVEVWRRTASEKWTLAIGDLYRCHRCRLWYSFWFSGHAPTSEYSGQMTQPQLLASLPAFAAELSRLSGEQGALGSLVLELAQQLEYVASQIGISSTEANFHGQVQACYSQVSSLFEYVRDLADLLQGISIIETSSGEFGQSRGALADLEVDVIGRAMLQEGIEATQVFTSVRSQMLEKSAVSERLKEELVQKRSALQFAVDTKETLARKLRSLYQEREEAITATAYDIGQRVTRVMALLKAFDKFKVSSREKSGNEEILPAITESSASKNRRRKSGIVPQAGSEADQGQLSSFSFMENERLVKILLRNIKSADHLKSLEGVLDKHETNSSTLHGVIASVDNALRQYTSSIQSSLLAQDPPNGRSSSESSTQASFLAAAQHSAKTNTVSKSGNAKVKSPASVTLSLQLPRSHEMVRALMSMKGALVMERMADGEQTESNLLDIANKLVKVCFKLFFEATDMADRLSSLEKGPSGESEEEEDAVAGAHDDGDDFNVALNGDVASASSAGNGGADSDGDPSSEEKPGSISEAHVQVKNRHGMQVLKRVEEKLCGQVMEHGQPRTLTVEEQASWLIESATKVDNLCVMYEGWTPWI